MRKEGFIKSSDIIQLVRMVYRINVETCHYVTIDITKRSVCVLAMREGLTTKRPWDLHENFCYGDEFDEVEEIKRYHKIRDYLKELLEESKDD